MRYLLLATEGSLRTLSRAPLTSRSSGKDRPCRLGAIFWSLNTWETKKIIHDSTRHSLNKVMIHNFTHKNMQVYWYLKRMKSKWINGQRSLRWAHVWSQSHFYKWNIWWGSNKSFMDQKYSKVLCVTHTFFSKNLIKSWGCLFYVGLKFNSIFSGCDSGCCGSMIAVTVCYASCTNVI